MRGGGGGGGGEWEVEVRGERRGKGMESEWR